MQHAPSRAFTYVMLMVVRNFRFTPAYIQPMNLYARFPVSTLRLSARSEKRPNTKVVRIQRSCDKVLQGCDIYIGRACSMGVKSPPPQSKWANPVTVRNEGSAATAVSKYNEYILKNPVLRKDLEELRGQILGCWCHPGPCHGDVLVAQLDRPDHVK